eukprot:scaffold212646_cov69-Attheya_sp.AAC.1
MEVDGVSREKPTCGARWAETVHTIRDPLVRVVLAITRHAATHPRAYIVDTNQDRLWSPANSYPVKHSDWINDKSRFPEQPRSFSITIHANDVNILSKEGVSRVFEALQTVQSTEGYADVCAVTDPDIEQTENQAPQTCEVTSVSQFWGDDLSLFDSTIFTDQDAISALSSLLFSDGTPVDRKSVFGFAVPQLPVVENAIEGGNIFSEEEIRLTSVMAYTSVIQIPPYDVDQAEDFEDIAID